MQFQQDWTELPLKQLHPLPIPENLDAICTPITITICPDLQQSLILIQENRSPRNAPATLIRYAHSEFIRAKPLHHFN
jgi:hypothetical protein